MDGLIDQIKQQLDLVKTTEDEEVLKLIKDFHGALAAKGLNAIRVSDVDTPTPTPEAPQPTPWPLEPEEYDRYSRQMIVPGIGIQGQLNLRSSKVLIIGAGGLGCPAAAYLAGSGVGTLGLVDGDTVEVSNLHRQIGHASSRVGVMKTESLAAYLRGINPLVKYQLHSENIGPENAERIVSQYDVVLDCTDRPAGRYLISDVCVLLQKPLVSAAALRTDGQLIVLNCPPVPAGSTLGAPCYRCVWRDPPRPEMAMTCGEYGVLGPAVGIMGTMQANEAIKIITMGRHFPVPAPGAATDPSLLVFADWKGFASDRSAIRSVGMKRKPACVACGPNRTITLEGIASGTPNYDDFCGGNVSYDVFVPPTARIPPTEYLAICKSESEAKSEDDVQVDKPGKQHVLLDVREPEHFSISSLPGAVNVRYRDVCRWLAGYDPEKQRSSPTRPSTDVQMPWEGEAHAGQNIWVVCRTGKDSKDVVAKMLAKGLDKNGAIRIGDITGGMKAWKEQVDGTMPFV